MTRRELIVTLACSAVAVTTAGAQRHPDFSGSWRVDRRASGYRGRGNSPREDSLRIGQSPSLLVISQDALTLTVEEHYIDGPHVVVYPVDSRTVRTKLRLGPGVIHPADITSKWQDGQLVSTVTVVVTGESRPARYEHRLWLDRDGLLMVQVSGVGSPNARRIAYRKQ